jgi:hypothetical protein
MKKNKHNYKLTDEQFLEAYRACEGNCSQTSKYIQDHFKIPYSKQAVQDRAENFPDEVEKMYSLMDNQSITKIMTFADNENNDIKLRSRLYVQVLNQNSRRKRLKLQEAKANPKNKGEEEPDGYFQIGEYELHFPSSEAGLPPEQELEWEKFWAEYGPAGKPYPPQLDAPPQNP